MTDPLDALREVIAQIVREEIAKAGLAPKSAADAYLSVAEAADLASVAPGTIRRWVRVGDLPRCGAGRLLRVPRGALEQLLRGGPTTTTTTPDLTIEQRAVAKVRRALSKVR